MHMYIIIYYREDLSTIMTFCFYYLWRKDSLTGKKMLQIIMVLNKAFKLNLSSCDFGVICSLPCE